MSFKTIAVLITDPAQDAQALEAARQIARRSLAHLEVYCLAVEQTRLEVAPMTGTGAMVDPVMFEAEHRRAKDAAETLAAWVRNILADEEIQVVLQAEVIADIGLDRRLSRLARYADLVVASRPYGKDRAPLLEVVAEAELFGTGAPVLIVPPDARDYGNAFDHVVIAWNDSAEALAAVRLAMPLLVAASRVDIVIVDPPRHGADRSDPGGRLCLMLVRHGIKAEVVILAQTLPSVSDVLLRYARERGAGAIVLGAYSHSRLREFILGGVTRSLLERSDLPLLMAH